MMIPISNLLTGKNNERIYFTRMADEILRYGRIRLFLFKPQAYLSFQKVGYNLEENEIILLETILSEGYFDNLEPETKSEYDLEEAYEFVKPSSVKPPYASKKVVESLHDYKYKQGKKKFIIKPSALDETAKEKTLSDKKSVTFQELEQEDILEDEKEIPEEEEEITKVDDIPSAVPTEVQRELCYQTAVEKIKGSLRQQFNSDVQELIFQNNTECTFQLYLFIIKLWNKDKVGLLSYNADAAELRRILWKQYSKFVELYKEKIFIILSDQGKKRIVERLLQGAIILGFNYE